MFSIDTSLLVYAHTVNIPDFEEFDFLEVVNPLETYVKSEVDDKTIEDS
jgi:hypothetical protein